MIATEAIAGSSLIAGGKIQPQHRDRLAVVYIRQSSPQQVLEHRESTALQYALQRRALEWGWPPGHRLAVANRRPWPASRPVHRAGGCAAAAAPA